ncbi:hypothetical protein ACLOJK_002478 [Asimina triloba]
MHFPPHDVSSPGFVLHESGTDDDGIGGEESVKVMSMVSFDVKMRELLRNICSIEVAVYSKASKEFVRLLGGDSGGELFCEYVRASPSCMELLEAWKLRQGKPGMAYILSLISVILEHPDGKYHVGDLERLTISRRLDKFARSIVETKMEDVYVELNSGVVKRQNAALLLMAAVVRRGIGLASEVAKVFDFKLPVFPKLAEVQLKKGGKRVKHSTRAAFTVFAMSFLEVGNPRLLRWILQQKDMYYGVLRRLSGDDENTIVHVLTKLRDNVLRRESLVPVGLRSVLFGSVTLEQLSTISGIPNGGPAADMAHEVLVMACTDPCNGLMPDLKLCENPLKGNPKRLLGLMKKLKATETEHHRALLLAIVHGRPLLGSAYMDEFPYVLEPRASHLWFAAISLAADLISSSVSGLSFTSFSSQFCDPPTLDCLEIQCILKCIIPHSVTRLVINRGLLHSDILVKHGSLRLLFEALKALDSFIGAINVSLENMHERELTVAMHPSQSKIKGLLGNTDLGNVNMDSTPAGIGETFPYSSAGQKWLSLRREIQNEVRAMLPDPQVLLKLLSSFNYGFSEMLEPSLKRGRGSEPFPKVNRMKKTKSNPSDENIDIIIGGVSAENGTEKTMGCCDDVKGNLATKEAAEAEKDDVSLAAEIWGLHELSVIGNGLKQAETFFYSKLLDALTLYLLNSGGKAAFEYVGQSPGRSVSSRGPEQLFKHLQPLINLTYSISEVSATGDKHSISEILAEVKKIKRSGLIDGINKVAAAFCSAIVCADPGDLLESFPSLICVTCQLLREDISFLTSIFFCERKLLSTVATFWPDMFFSGLELVGSTIFGSYQENNGCSLNIDFDSIDSSVAFSLFLEHIPFHVLFSALSAFGHSDLLCSTKILDLLRAKLSKCSVDGRISLLRLMLFWMHQIRLSYTAKPSAEMEQLLESFSILIEHMLESLFVVSSGSSKTDGQSSTIACMQQLADSIFRHPVVTASLSDPFACDRKSMDENFGDSLEAFLSLSKHCIHPIDGCILRLVNHVMDYVLSVINSCKSTVYDAVYGPSLNSFKLLIQQAVLTFKEKIDQYVISGDLIPLLQSFYVFHSFMGFISPYELMELAYWIFCKVDQNDSVGCKSSGLSVLSVGIFIAQGAFDMLASHLHQQDMTKVSCSLLWRMEYNSFNFSLLKQVYYRIMTYATTFSLACADLCLLKAWNSFCHTKLLPPETSVLPLGMVMERLVISSPIEVLVHFIHKTSMTKAKALLRLTEASPLYLSLFGHVFLYILNKVSPDVDATDANSTFSPVRDMLLEKSGCSLSDEDFLLLLPSALSFLTSISVRSVKAEVKDLRRIPSFYSRILFDCFSRWSSAFGNIFQEEYSEYMPKSLEEFLRICSSSFLGKAMQMLQCYFYLNENSISNKKRVKLFNSIYPRSSVHNELLNCDLCELDVHSSKQLLNFTHGVVAKISLSRMLLFPQDRLFKFSSLAVDKMKETPLEVGSDDRLEHAKLRFMNIIVGALDKIVKTFAVSDSQNYNGSNCSQILRYLEVFILENVVQISMNMRSELTQMHEIPFLKPFIQSSLLHRFEDPSTLRALHNILLSLNRGRFSSGEVFELLLAHSQFVPTILWNESTSDSSGLSQSGPLSRPISSMLKMLNVPSTDKTVSHAKGCREISSEKPSLCERKLEVIKLLRVLYSLKSKQFVTNPGKEASMNSRELLSLLLSGYGATLNETDLEIFHLMHEIESTEGSDCGSIAEMDYLWGSSVLRLRREQALERFLSSSNTADCETTEEWRRRQYRENIPVDPKICVMTVLHFCYDRVAWTGPMPLDVEKLQQFDFVHSSKLTPASMGEVQRYDPAFLLCFSIHGLSMGYIKPLEFAGLGLLAVAFVSLSSPDEGIRKLGYEVLGRFKKSLESYQSSKDVLRFRLLLTYLQNGIVEPWQKIPSPTAIFVAEASFILLDPAHDHYFTTSNFLVRCPQVDLKAIPLFHTLFGSSSVHFKTDHLWILRLSYASLKLDDDAQILMKKCIIEQLLSFYVSSLSDHESKLLILQNVVATFNVASCQQLGIAYLILTDSFIVKKAMEFHRLAHYLVERCGLISWLSSILPLSMELFGEHRDLYLSQMSMVLKDREKLSKFLMWVVATALWSTRCKKCHTYLTLAEEQSEEVPISKLLRWLTASLLLWKISGKCRKTCLSFRTGTLQSLFESIDPELEENISNCEVVAATLLYLQQLTGTNSEVLPSVVAALCLLLCSNAKRSTAPSMKHKLETGPCGSPHVEDSGTNSSVHL